MGMEYFLLGFDGGGGEVCIGDGHHGFWVVCV